MDVDFSNITKTNQDSEMRKVQNKFIFLCVVNKKPCLRFTVIERTLPWITKPIQMPDMLKIVKLTKSY